MHQPMVEELVMPARWKKVPGGVPRRSEASSGAASRAELPRRAPRGDRVPEDARNTPRLRCPTASGRAAGARPWTTRTASSRRPKSGWRPRPRLQARRSGTRTRARRRGFSGARGRAVAGRSRHAPDTRHAPADVESVEGRRTHPQHTAQHPQRPQNTQHTPSKTHQPQVPGAHPPAEDARGLLGRERERAAAGEGARRQVLLAPVPRARCRVPFLGARRRGRLRRACRGVRPAHLARRGEKSHTLDAPRGTS